VKALLEPAGHFGQRLALQLRHAMGPHPLPLAQHRLVEVQSDVGGRHPPALPGDALSVRGLAALAGFEGDRQRHHRVGQVLRELP
jgi:hypothetical protein